MNLKDTIKIAFTGLKTNKARSVLTILGIVIGVTAIMLMMSLGHGAEGLILGEIAGLGGETIVIRPGKEPTGPSNMADTLFSDSIKKRDLDLLRRKENVPDLVSAMPMLMVPGSISYEGETFRPSIFGGSSEFLVDAFDVYPEVGVLFDESDIQSRASVVLIGSRVKKELFGAEDAIGKFVKIKDRKFRVIGVFPPKGQVAFLNIDDMAMVPYTTAQEYLLGIDHYHEVIVKTTSTDVVDRAVIDIERTLRDAHNITDPSKDDFHVHTQQGLVDQIRTIITTLTTFLASVVSIALVVGGVGVMNIMLVSVTERTREIGLRKALGATEKNIMRQFLFEATMLTATGGLVGVVLGALLSFLVSFVLSRFVGFAWEFSVSMGGAALGVGVSMFIGILFGWYPAKQAARKNPIEALRYE